MSIFAFCPAVKDLISTSDSLISGYSVQASLYRASLLRLSSCITADAHFATIMITADNAVTVSNVSIVTSF